MSAFIDERREAFGVEPICRTLGVSASAYYERRSGRRSERALEDERLTALIERTHAENYHAYGYRRMWKALGRLGEALPRCRVQRVMRTAGIEGAKRRGKPWRTTTPDPVARRRPDLVLGALRMALHQRGPGADVELVHHSDRGSQYTSADYTQELADHGVLASVGSVGDATTTPSRSLRRLLQDRADRRPCLALPGPARARDRGVGRMV